MSKKNVRIHIEGKNGFEDTTRDLETKLAVVLTFDPEGDDATASNVAVIGSCDETLTSHNFARAWAEVTAKAVSKTFMGHDTTKYLSMFRDEIDKEYDKAFKREMKGCRALLKELFGKYLDEDKEEDKEEEED